LANFHQVRVHEEWMALNWHVGLQTRKYIKK
jgi:hypothetical protein